jgi:dephospho-CoA kinase
MQHIIGLTGGIGSGKSTIANELAKRGYAVYDCDREAKRIIAQNQTVQAAIIDLLGEEAFVDGTYNTAYVAQRVFAEPQLLDALNSIVHPAVLKDLRDLRDLKDPKDFLFIESAILFEAGLAPLCDKIIVVEAPEEVRIARTIARDYQGQATPANINKVRARIRAQQKSPASTEALQGKIYTVLNDGSLVLSRVIDLVCDIAAR